jgi:hypothetical protein
MQQFLQKICRKQLKMRRNPLQLLVALIFFCAIILLRFAPAQTAVAWPDTFLARVEALALVETLTLDKWCTDHKLSGETKDLHARFQTEVDETYTRENLAFTPPR